MSRYLVSTIIFCSLIFAAGHADDLYLLRIDNQSQLQSVRSIVNNAHGVFGDRFVVMLDDSQIAALLVAGIDIEVIVEDAQPEDYYAAYRVYERQETPVTLTPERTAGRKNLVRLGEGDDDVLRRAGYMVKSIAEKNTPFFYNAPVTALPELESYPTDSLADLINRDSLYNYVTRLEAFQSRYVETDSIHAARNWLREKFIEFGYTDIEFQPFTLSITAYGIEYENLRCYNVACLKTGTVYPDKLIVIGAHYDSYNHYGPSDKEVWSPGADDNASGTATVLELARVFKDFNSQYSMLFVPFSAEEIGLWGAQHCADLLYNDGAEIELMINFDMDSYQGDDVLDFDIFRDCPFAYAKVFSDAGTRVENLIPIHYTGTYCDSEPFGDCGYYNITPVEAEFTPGIHTDYDISSILDFSYMEKIVRMTAAAVAIIDQSAPPIACTLKDAGDGQSLRVSWENCNDTYQYKIAYGIEEDVLTDTIDVPPITCQYDLTGLTEGQRYFCGVISIPPDGYPPIGIMLSSEVPMVTPRTPERFTVEPALNSIELSWAPSTELDFSHYRVYRRPEFGEYELLADNITDNFFIDGTAEPYQKYTYAVAAVDADLNESTPSAGEWAVAATFDGGILLVDETQDDGNNPTESEQLNYYITAFGDSTYTRQVVQDGMPSLSRSTVGQYNSIFYVDDDYSAHFLSESIDSLDWYFDYETDFFLAGWETIYSITGQSYFYPGNFYYENFGITYIAQSPINDFTGAAGVNGWPDLEIRGDTYYHSPLQNVDIFTAAPKAEVIYTFNSISSSTFYGNKPVGIALDTHHGKRVILGFPLYYLTEESAQALIAKVFEYFSEESVLYGDANGDRALNILDITHLVNYLYKGGPEPADMNNADPNASCTVNILDVTYLIGYLYKGGPEPLAGCVY